MGHGPDAPASLSVEDESINIGDENGPISAGTKLDASFFFNIKAMGTKITS